MAIPDARTATYVNFFRSQRGGGDVPVFHGLGRYQSGQGFGDFFRGLLRRVIPIALNVGKSALSAMSDAQDSGASMQDTLKAAIRPAARAAIGGTLAQIDRAQQGGGRKHRKKKRKAVYKGVAAKKSKHMAYNF